MLWKINGESHETNGTLDHGIRLSDGDGTVPLISLGTLCRKHWRHKSLNPSGIRIVSREHPHEPVNLFKDLRYAHSPTSMCIGCTMAISLRRER